MTLEFEGRYTLPAIETMAASPEEIRKKQERVRVLALERDAPEVQAAAGTRSTARRLGRRRRRIEEVARRDDRVVVERVLEPDSMPHLMGQNAEEGYRRCAVGQGRSGGPVSAQAQIDAAGCAMADGQGVVKALGRWFGRW